MENFKALSNIQCGNVCNRITCWVKTNSSVLQKSSINTVRHFLRMWKRNTITIQNRYVLILYLHVVQKHKAKVATQSNFEIVRVSSFDVSKKLKCCSSIFDLDICIELRNKCSLFCRSPVQGVLYIYRSPS